MTPIASRNIIPAPHDGASAAARQPAETPAARLFYGIGPYVAGCALLLLVIPLFGMRQFGAFDFSALIETGWRQYCGQRPYHDFYCTYPPAFYLLAKYAMEIGGVRWSSFVYLDAIFAAVVFVWMFWLSSRLFGSSGLAFLLAIAAESFTHIFHSFWSYNISAVSTATVFLLSCLAVERRSDVPRRWAILSFIASLGFLLLCKPNIGACTALLGVAALVFAAIARRDLRSLFAVASMVAAAAGLATGFLLVNGVNPWDVYHSYLKMTHRGTKLFPGFDNLLNHSWPGVAMLFAPLLLIVERILAQPLTAQRVKAVVYWFPGWIFLAFTLSGFYALATDAEHWNHVYPLFMFGVVSALSGLGWTKRLRRAPQAWQALAARRPESGRFRWRKFRRAAIAAYFVAIALLAADCALGGYRRDKVLSIGEGTFYEPVMKPGSVQGLPFFAGVRGGPRLHRTLEQLADVVERRRAGAFYFGPRMEFAYAAFGLAAPRGLPIWWHPGTSFSVDDYRRIAQNWKAARFDTLIFLKDDFTFHDADFVPMLMTLYDRDQTYRDLTVFYRKADADGAASEVFESR